MAALCWPAALSAQRSAPVSLAKVRVPFVGCKSAGQWGPRKPPRGIADVAVISPRLKSRFSYYEARSLGVLAPRFWHCFAIYGSRSSTLLVAPQRINARMLL